MSRGGTPACWCCGRWPGTRRCSSSRTSSPSSGALPFSLPFFDRSLPFLGLPLPFLGLPPPFHCRSLTVHCLSWTSHCLPLPSLDLPLPSLDLSLPFIDLSLPFCRYIWVAVHDTKLEIRETACEALRACLELTVRRERNAARSDWYSGLFQQVPARAITSLIGGVAHSRGQADTGLNRLSLTSGADRLREEQPRQHPRFAARD